jgi:hypothetical protein
MSNAPLSPDPAVYVRRRRELDKYYSEKMWSFFGPGGWWGYVAAANAEQAKIEATN